MLEFMLWLVCFVVLGPIFLQLAFMVFVGIYAMYEKLIQSVQWDPKNKTRFDDGRLTAEEWEAKQRGKVAE